MQTNQSNYPPLLRRNSIEVARNNVADRAMTKAQRQLYNEWLLHRSRDGRDVVQQVIVDEFYRALKSLLTSLFTGIHAVASGTVHGASAGKIITGLQASLLFVPYVGSALKGASNALLEARQTEQMKRISLLLGNYGDMDQLGEDIAAHLTAYHQRELTHPSVEISALEVFFAPLRKPIEHMIDHVLDKKALPVANQHRELLELIVAQLMIGLSQVSEALVPDDLARYLLQRQKKISHQVMPLLSAWDTEETARWQRSFHVARLSLLAYENKSKIEELAQHFNSIDKGEFHYFLNQDIRCFIIANEHQLCCVFRGTVGILDTANITSTLLEATNYSVHAGFNTALNAVWTQVQQILIAHQKVYPEASLLFTGHAAGGALAMLAGAKWLYQHPGDDKRLQVITFGQPRVFKTQTVPTELKACCHRFINVGDPVPLLPTESILNYQHVGHEYYLPPANQSFSWTAGVNNPGISLESHEMMQYLQQLIIHAKNANIELEVDEDRLQFQRYEDTQAYQRQIYQRLDISDTVPLPVVAVTPIVHIKPVHELYQLIQTFQQQLAREDLVAMTETAQHLNTYFSHCPNISFAYTRAAELEALVWEKKCLELPAPIKHALMAAFYQCLLQGLLTSGGRGYKPKVTDWDARLNEWSPLIQTPEAAGLAFVVPKLKQLLNVLLLQQTKPNPEFSAGLSVLQKLMQGQLDEASIRIQALEKCIVQLNAVTIKGAEDFALVLVCDALAATPILDLVLLDGTRAQLLQRVKTPMSTLLAGAGLNLLLRALLDPNEAVRHEVLLGDNERMGLRPWLQGEYQLDIPNETWIMKGLLGAGLKAAADAIQAPVLQALAHGAPQSLTVNISFSFGILGQALNQVIDNDLNGSEIKLTALLLWHSLLRENGTLTALEQIKLGAMAFDAKQFELSKCAYIKAHRLLQPTLGTQELVPQTQALILSIASKIAAVIMLQMTQPDTQTWHKVQLALEVLRYAPEHLGAIETLFKLGLGQGLGEIKRRLTKLNDASMSNNNNRNNANDNNQNDNNVTPNNKEALLKAGKAIWTGAFSGTLVLSDAAVQQLFENENIRASNKVDGEDSEAQEGQHRVACIGEGLDCLHIKENPGHVGLAFSAWALNEWMFYETGVTANTLIPVEPGIIERLYQGQKQRFIVQASPTIPGNNLRQVFKTAGEQVPRSLGVLNPQAYSAAMTVSMLLDLEDARPANWIVTIDADGQTRLTSVDNDHVWVREELSKGKLVVKNIIYCLDNMNKAIEPSVRSALLNRSFSHTHRMQAWLYSLQCYNNHILQAFGEDTLKALHERKQENEKVILEAYSHPESLGRLYFKWFLLRRSLDDTSILTHQQLLKAVQPQLASIYASAKHTHPKQRFDELTKGLFTKSGGTQTTNTQLTQMVLGKVAQDYASFARARTTPQALLSLLTDLKNDAMLDFIERDVLHGNLSLFRDLSEHQEAVLLRIKSSAFKQGYTAEFHKAFLEALSPELTALTLKGNLFLTDDELVATVKKMPRLTQIILEDCPHLTGYAKGFLGTYDWLTEFCKRGVKTIKLIRCEALDSKLLDVIPTLTPIPSVNVEIRLLTFLRLIAEGEQDKAEETIKADPTILLQRGHVTDLSGRTFKNITAFQYAVWALDWHMWTMLLKYLPVEEQKVQASQFETGAWVNEHGVTATQLIQNLIDALKQHIDNYDGWSKSQREQHWCKRVGGAQLLLPVHVINEYCRTDRLSSCRPTFLKEWSLPRTRKLSNWEVPYEEEWFTAAHNGGKLGTKWAVLQVSSSKIVIGPSSRAIACSTTSRMGGHVPEGGNHESISKLLEVRTTQHTQLMSSFKNINANIVTLSK